MASDARNQDSERLMAKRQAVKAEVLAPIDQEAFDAAEATLYEALTRGTPGSPPDDPLFWRALRLQVDGPFTRPYSQHPWIYSAVNARATPISQLSFQLYKAKPLADREVYGTTSYTPEGHKKASERIRAACPRMRKSMVESVAAIPDPVRRTAALRRAAPWLPPAEIVRAIADVEDINGGPWYDLLQRPNGTMTRSQLWQATVIHMSDESGECFWQLLGKSGAKVGPAELPAEVWPVGGDRWLPDMKKDGVTLVRWKKRKDTSSGPGTGGSIREEFDYWELYQVIHPHNYNPSSPYRGLSPILPIKIEVEADYRAALYNLAFLKNGALPGGWFTTDKPLTDKQAQEWLRDYEARHGGQKKAGRPAMLTGGVKFTPSATNHREMQWQQMRATSMQTILAAGFGTSRAMVGISADHNRASMETAYRVHWDSVLLPIVHYLEDVCNVELFTPERAKAGGGELFGLFDLSTVPALKENLSELLDSAQKMQALGYPTDAINEALELNLPELGPGVGDVSYVPGSLTPVGAPDEGKKKPGGPGDEPKPTEDEGKEPTPPEPEEEPSKGLLRLSTPEARDAHWAGIVERIMLPGEERYGKRLKAFLFRLRSAQIRLLSEGGVKAASLFDLKEWRQALRDEMRPVYRKIVASAANDAEAELARSKHAAAATEVMVRASETEIAVLAENLSTKVGRIVKTIRAQLERLIAEAEKEDADLAHVQDLIRAYFNDLASGKSGKLAVIARTESAAATSAARDMVFTENGVELQDWLTSEDEKVRDNHVVYGDAPAEAVGFNYATLVGESYMLRRPHDPDAPAGETINCRCVCVPVIKP